MHLRETICIALGFMLLGAAPAASQGSNSPYEPGRTGMSYAARQAILDAQILNVRPRALVRGPNGELLDVQRRNGQAFLRSPDSGAFIPGARPNRGWPTGLGTGLGWTLPSFAGRSSGYGIATMGTARSLDSWISLIPVGEEGGYYGSIAQGADGTPIDSWIQQLNLI